MKKEISDYFVQMADAELDRMWNEGTLNEETYRELPSSP